MDKSNNISKYKPNETTKLFDKLNLAYSLVGLPGFWVSDVVLSPRVIKVQKILAYLLPVTSFLYSLSIAGAFFTQKDLSEEHADIRLMFGFIVPSTLSFYITVVFYKVDVREIFYCLAVVLKEHHNDAILEKEMIKKMTSYSISLPFCTAMLILFNGLRALYGVITAGENFITLIPSWPDVHDPSLMAGVVRVLIYFYWWIFSAQIMSSFSVLVIMLIAICYQFQNLQSYFYSLDNIFCKDLSQEEKEIKYEQAFKLGIQMHSMTLQCIEHHKIVCKQMFGFMNILFFAMLMSELITLLSREHTLMNTMDMLFLILSTLLSLGLFMWNGGDITVEASKLPVAMYYSGWQNCRGRSSVRIRNLVHIAIAHAQKPVVYKTLGVVEYSYEAYVTLVKMPYTLVSVFY